MPDHALLQSEMVGRGERHVLLDISHKPRGEVLEHFPNVAAHCRSLGLDITQVWTCCGMFDDVVERDCLQPGHHPRASWPCMRQQWGAI